MRSSSARPASVASSSRPHPSQVGSSSKGKGRAAVAQDIVPSIEGTPTPGPTPVAEGAIMRNIDDHRQALLHHGGALVELGQAKVEGLKAVAAAFHAAVDATLDAHQAGLDTHVAELKFLFGE
ncbi:hypothetical protein V493_08139 [Pseudogymnoascus sp. VKM F-4281 (FW-2241)]|nr:hypothetical protein V493_08139 [Pseudogymnoascus sp. VKM F-4281 (FW-2241)]